MKKHVSGPCPHCRGTGAMPTPVADLLEELIRIGEPIPPGTYVVERTIYLRAPREDGT